ncbi:MAG TPA: 2-dehydro-3-deoxygalactonokinase [Flavisolibacter sp.]
MKKASLFLSCDWGTSSFRLRLVEEPYKVLVEEKNDNGVTAIHDKWKQTGKQEEERLDYYQAFLLKQIMQLGEKAGRSLNGIPMILSGMASSAIGMLELPYKQSPFGADGTDLPLHTLIPTKSFPHEILMVSGIRSDDDVMRGEEIQLVGSYDSNTTDSTLYIFPGTHSKHIRVEKGRAVEFQTYMTGELFQLLSTKSILSTTVERPNGDFGDEHWQCFVEGIEDSESFNPLRAFFFARTNHLFQKMSKTENFFYLSGLLIGLELHELNADTGLPVILVTDAALKPFYAIALQQLNLDYNLHIVDVDKAIVKGHYKVFELSRARAVTQSFSKPLEHG